MRLRHLKLSGVLILTFWVLLTACNDENKEEHHHDHHDNHEQMHDTMDHTDDMHSGNSDDIPSPTKFTNVSGDIQQKVQNLTHSYLQVKTALVNGDANEAAEKAQTVKKNGILLHTDRLPKDQTNLLSKHLVIIENNAEIIADNTSDIEIQRIAFADLSRSVYVLAKAFGPAQTLYYQYCPMAFDNDGAYWVSAAEEIQNPYFGSKMLKCGEVRDVTKK